VITRNRPRELALVLDRLAALALDEVVVVENGATGATAEAGAEERGGRVIRSPENLGIAARNLAADQVRGELLLMLDDDSYPCPGTLETLAAAFRANPRLAVAAGEVVDVDEQGRIVRSGEPGTFDWFLRAGRRGVPQRGFPAFFFPEGACVIRRAAFLEAGGFFTPFFFACVELELTTRLLALGWDVRYFPGARFEHLKAGADRASPDAMLYHRIRNHAWYLWLRFPAPLAARRLPAYLAFDLVEAVYRGAPGAWARAVRDAWRFRERVRGDRRPLPRDVIRRAELNRGRMHLRLLAHQLRRRLPAPRSSRER
jgi:GT2 family glycosyltransferase